MDIHNTFHYTSHIRNNKVLEEKKNELLNMGHEYNEMIDILSESINLTESIPSSEGLIGDHWLFSLLF